MPKAPTPPAPPSSISKRPSNIALPADPRLRRACAPAIPSSAAAPNHARLAAALALFGIPNSAACRTRIAPDSSAPSITKRGHGHFGRELPQFPWERTDKVAPLRKFTGVGKKGVLPMEEIPF